MFYIFQPSFQETKMHYFLKKTGELVKRKKIPSKKLDLEKKNGLYVRIVLGDRKDKSFFVYKNQLKLVEETTGLSNFEIECMKKAHTCSDSWRQLCSVIKSSRGNNYPKDWFTVLRKEKLEKQNLESEGQKTSGLNILNMMSGLFKSLGQPSGDEQGSASVPSGLPTIILLETDPDSFGKKKAGGDKDATDKQADTIKFLSVIEGTSELTETVDFIARYHLPNHKSTDIVPIPTQSTFTFDGPLQQLSLKNSKPFFNSLELLTWLLEIIRENILLLQSPYSLEDIGIRYVRKTQPLRYTVFLLY